MKSLLRSALLTIAATGLMAAPAQALQSGSVTKTSGHVRATLSWQAGQGSFTGPARITITRGGHRKLQRDVAGECQLCGSMVTPRAALHVRDLDGDGEPEVFVDLYSAGAHCCSTTVVYYRRASGAYGHRVIAFGDSGYRLKDIDRNGIPEFVSDDDRFAYLFASYAESWRPPLVLAFDHGRLLRRTSHFPALVAADLKALDKTLPQIRQDQGDLRGLIAARAADLYLLHRGGEVLPYLRAAEKRGDLKGDSTWPRGAKFISAVLRDLRTFGYR